MKKDHRLAIRQAFRRLIDEIERDKGAKLAYEDIANFKRQWVAEANPLAIECLKERDLPGTF